MQSYTEKVHDDANIYMLNGAFFEPGSPALSRMYIIALIFTLFQPFFSLAVPPITKYLGIQQGLSNNSIRCIYQDHNGFMWFGTYDGLNRFDGYDFKIFRNDIYDTFSLPHNYITAIGEDHLNNIWIGTGQGISLYNNLTSKFHPGMYIPFGKSQEERIPLNVNAIKTDLKGNLFIATNSGGLLVQPVGSAAVMQLLCAKDDKGICRNDIQCIAIDKKQSVWLFVRELGLCIYDAATKEILPVNARLKSASCMESDNEGNLWIGTAEGLYKFSVQTRSFSEMPVKLSSKVIACLTFDRQHNMWIGTEGGGVDIFNPETEEINYLLPGEGKNALSSESAFAIYEDHESRKWIGTPKGGINIIDPQENKFHTILHDPLNANSLVNNFVSAFYEDSARNLWIGTDGGGISYWNRKQNSFTNYRHKSGNPQSLSFNSVPSFKEDYLGNFWIATFGNGINKFKKTTGTFERYPCVNELTGEENNLTWLLYEDREGNLWATTYANGRLYRLNRLSNRFEVFSQNFADLFTLFEDREGTLWAGSYGLSKVDKQNKTYVNFEIQKPVRAILEDKNGQFWLGTEGGGLVLFDRVHSKIAARFTTHEGLCNNSVLNILEDDKGFLWLSTFNGLSKFNPRDKTFKNYYQEDGLQSSQFIYNAALRLHSGEMVFGGIKGFNIFYPDSIQSRDYNPTILITGLRINNTEVSSGDRYISSISSDKIEAVQIPFNDAVLSMDFAALEYSAPGKISYAYFLEGWDKGWTYCGNIRTANYTKLTEGHYTLRIKATNAEGIWNTQEVHLKIDVLPPWFRSWWAYISYFLIVAAGLILYQRYRAHQTQLAFEIGLAKLNTEKEKAEREIERVTNEKEKEINEKRLTFFTDISHEFRTPLTLVINPLKDILRKSEPQSEIDISELTTVYRNARRLLNLVDQLMLFRKADAGVGQLKITKQNLTQLCRDVFSAFVPQAKALKIDYNFEGANEWIEIYVDREKIEIILYNLISNALKYTPQGGKVALAIKETENYIEVVIEDNGYGMPKNVGDKLFERFYQVQDKDFPAKSGFGIGLYLVRHFVEEHKGKISYQSEPGKGSTFIVQFQKGKEHFGSKPIFEELPEDNALSIGLIEQASVLEDKSAFVKKGELEALITEDQSVLVVDDDEQMRSYLNQIFADKYTVYQAENGQEGLKLAYQHLPDIIVSDVNMPVLSGIGFCKAIKEDPSLSHIPVILLTVQSSLERRLEGIEGGADDYITKPFEKELLIAKVINILKRRSNLQNYFYNVITLQENPLKISEEYKEFLEKCIAVVEKYLDDEDFSVKTLASELSMSHSTLYKKVKSISGQSLNSFIRFIRLRKAADLLINTNSNINETAAQVGFASPKYFREQFAKLFGMNPSEYSKKYKKAFGKSYNLKDEKNKD